MKPFHPQVTPLSFSLLLVSLLTVVKGQRQCETEVSNIATCATTLSAREGRACGTCLEDVPASSTAASCEEVASTICSALSACETSCGACIDEIESYADCLMSDCFGIDCASGWVDPYPPETSASRTGTVIGSFFTVSLGLSSLLLV